MSFHTKHTAHLSWLELIAIYALLAGSVIALTVYVIKFGGLS